MEEDKSEFNFKLVLTVFDEQTLQIGEGEKNSEEMRVKYQGLIQKYKELNKMIQEKEELFLQNVKVERVATQTLRAYFQAISTMKTVVNTDESGINSYQKNTFKKRMELIQKMKESKKNLIDLYSQYEVDTFSSVIHTLACEIESVQKGHSNLEDLLRSVNDKKYIIGYEKNPALNFLTKTQVEQLKNDVKQTKAELVKSTEKIAYYKRILANKEKKY